MRRTHEWAVRHPRVVDACLAALVAGFAVPVTAGGANAPGVLAPGAGVTGLGWLWFLAVHVPLGWRRRAPAVVFWVVLGLVGACVLIGVTGVFLIFAPLFALYAVARYASPRQLWPAVGAGMVAIGAAALRGDPGWPALIGVISILTATVLLGVLLQLRRRYLVERAQHREQQARLTVAAERTQIAREVHDIVAHNLAVMVALADGASATAATNPGKAADLMREASMTGRLALSEMRRLVNLLREGGMDELAPQPDLADLDQLVEQVRAAGPRVEMTFEGAAPQAPGVGLAVYRIVQEALTNTLKHAGPRAGARVRLRYAADGVDVEIVDDGAGRPAAPAASGGHGLAGIRERAAAYGGRAEAGPAPGTGWRVRARLPLNDDSEVRK